jgi:hypothetical protein
MSMVAEEDCEIAGLDSGRLDTTGDTSCCYGHD